VGVIVIGGAGMHYIYAVGDEFDPMFTRCVLSFYQYHECGTSPLSDYDYSFHPPELWFPSFELICLLLCW
jgi:hypothetical protein